MNPTLAGAMPRLCSTARSENGTASAKRTDRPKRHTNAFLMPLLGALAVLHIALTYLLLADSGSTGPRPRPHSKRIKGRNTANNSDNPKADQNDAVAHLANQEDLTTPPTPAPAIDPVVIAADERIRQAALKTLRAIDPTDFNARLKPLMSSAAEPVSDSGSNAC